MFFFKKQNRKKSFFFTILLCRIILDLSGTLLDRRHDPLSSIPCDLLLHNGRSVYLRPFAREFVQKLFSMCVVGVWSSMYAKSVVACTHLVLQSNDEKPARDGDGVKFFNSAIDDAFPMSIQPLGETQFSFVFTRRDGIVSAPTRTEPFGSVKPLDFIFKQTKKPLSQFNPKNTLIIDDSPKKGRMVNNLVFFLLYCNIMFDF